MRSLLLDPEDVCHFCILSKCGNLNDYGEWIFMKWSFKTSLYIFNMSSYWLRKRSCTCFVSDQSSIWHQTCRNLSCWHVLTKSQPSSHLLSRAAFFTSSSHNRIRWRPSIAPMNGKSNKSRTVAKLPFLDQRGIKYFSSHPTNGMGLRRMSFYQGCWQSQHSIARYSKDGKGMTWFNGHSSWKYKLAIYQLNRIQIRRIGKAFPEEGQSPHDSYFLGLSPKSRISDGANPWHKSCSSWYPSNVLYAAGSRALHSDKLFQQRKLGLINKIMEHIDVGLATSSSRTRLHSSFSINGMPPWFRTKWSGLGVTTFDVTSHLGQSPLHGTLRRCNMFRILFPKNGLPGVVKNRNQLTTKSMTSPIHANTLRFSHPCSKSIQDYAKYRLTFRG